jgi:hypothetical protein
MSGLFGSAKAPAPDPEIAAAQKRQEERLEAEEAQKKREIASRRRARLVGGQRMLLSPEREDAQMGIQSTLGTE